MTRDIIITIIIIIIIIIKRYYNRSDPPKNAWPYVKPNVSGFGVLEVACWPLVPKFAGSHPAEAVRFLGRKNRQHAFLRRGSKAVGTMS